MKKLICRLSGALLFAFLGINAVIYGWGVGNMAGITIGAFCAVCVLSLVRPIFDSPHYDE